MSNDLYGSIAKKLAALLQEKTIGSMEILNEWMDEAIEAEDVEMQRRLLKLMKSETERAKVLQKWQEGDRDYIMALIYPELEKAKLNGHSNGKH